MQKKPYFFLIVSIIVSILILPVWGYAADKYDAIQSVLQAGYTADNYDAIQSVFRGEVNDTLSMLISFIPPTEADNSTFSRNWIAAKVSLNEAGFRNLTFNLYNSSALVNQTTFNDSTRLINWTGLAGGTYYYNATTYVQSGETNSTETRNITLDIITPLITGVQANVSNLNRMESFQFNCTVSDALPSSGISVHMDMMYSNGTWLNNTAMAPLGGNVYSASYNVNSNDPLGTYVVACRANDNAGNTAESSITLGVYSATSLYVQANATVLAKGQAPVLLIALLKYGNATGIQSQNINFYYNGISIGSAATNLTGYASAVWDTSALGSGTYRINATYSQNSTLFTRASYNDSLYIYVKQLNITYAINDTIIYSTDSGMINGTIYSEPGHAPSAGTPVNISVNSGSADASGKTTDGNGGYNFTYLPSAVSSITYVNFTLNATDAGGLTGAAASPVGALKVYPAFSKLNVSISTDKTNYNISENVTINVEFRNNETGGLLTGALLRAKIYRNSTGAQVGTLDLPERSGAFAGTYLANFSTSGLTDGGYYINVTSEADYNAPISGSGKMFYVNPATLSKNASITVGTENATYNQSGVANIFANITNTGSAAILGNLTIRIERSGGIIAVVNQTNGISVPVGGVHASTGTSWNTGNNEYGSFDVVAVYSYLDENNTLRNASSTRTITVNENRSVLFAMNTDKDSYKSNQPTLITADISNTGNAVLNGASLVYTVKSGATTIATYTDNLDDSRVSIGEVYHRSWLWNTARYAAGTYTVEAKVSDSTLAVWTVTKNIQINETMTAAINGLSVDVMPPANYVPGQMIYVYGLLNATGNRDFTGNLSLRYHNNRLNTDTYDNRTAVSTGFSMFPSVNASAATIDVGTVNLTAGYSWIDEDGVKREVYSSVIFSIGGTSVSVNTGTTNTYGPDDTVPLYVHVAGAGGNITGLASGNFTITDGTKTYTPPMTEQGSGQYLFTFAKNTFATGSYVISVTVTDPSTGVPGTGTANLFIGDHWVTLRMNADNALVSPESDADRGYAAAKSGQALVAIVQRGGTLDSLSSGSSNLVMKQKLSANRFNLVMTQGNINENIRDRIKLIDSGEFEKYASPSFGFALTKNYHVTVSREYQDTDIVGVDVGTFRPGMYNLVIRNDGASNGKSKIVVSRK